ncbi:hypothetical protein BT96DRAFT_948754 [Gymnopus androsaceus JB14]|uniref:Uncharacterized protein n=1 Tax=Gymnopus androsaceus JB14 TaxID=1447944 RepID=A0A6A4GNP0_9AGAR|nr:hypothetical protein BT96DRAFT_948754 [Gymnopus androsaceus JB14]
MGLKRFGRILDGGNERLPFEFVIPNDALKQQLVVKEVVLDKVVEELVEEVIAEAVFDVVEVVRESRIVILAEVVVSAFELVAAVVVDSPEKKYTFNRAIDPWESQIIRKIRTLVNYELESWAIGWFEERTVCRVKEAGVAEPRIGGVLTQRVVEVVAEQKQEGSMRTRWTAGALSMIIVQHLSSIAHKVSDPPDIVSTSISHILSENCIKVQSKYPVVQLHCKNISLCNNFGTGYWVLYTHKE